MKKVTFLLLTCCIFFSCNKKDGTAGVEVRIHNATTLQIEKLIIPAPGGNIIFDMLNPKATTGYRSFAAFPAHPAFIVETSGRQESLTAESTTPVYSGFYTCKLVYNAYKQFSIELIKD
ncbi:hypothetical protein [Agriterribacter sp.]|uniref:hypothetical protein n=1 Tax=Agriterribacter sp. TaxID=2821509 RepID=UPI002B6B2B85|nr:hypothetical protein [Agriterribacter sp.]HRO48103.1 hypothetical protein [Agriterribacter sp.]HRQ17973.1 hypothetical protein [Agriterribacter sp.]